MARALLQMPTGSGKTRTATELIIEHLNREENEISQVVWLANTRELCEQAIQCVSETWDHLGKKICRFNRGWDGNIQRIENWRENMRFLCSKFTGSLVYL